MRDLNLRMVLTGRDAGAGKVLREWQQQVQRSNSEVARSTEQSSRQQASALRRLGQQRQQAQTAMARIGIRSERDIQREIRRTEQAYRSLAASGKASKNDMARAAMETRRRVAELRGELGQTSRAQRAMTGFRMGGAALTAGTAAYMTLKPAMDDQKQLNSNISQVAWQAFGEDDSKSSDWIATEGKTQIKSLTRDLVEKNGGNADVALGLINSMMANGMSFDQARDNSSASYRAMIASSEGGQYNPEDTAKLMKVLSDFGFKGPELANAFENAMKSGMQGNFEIADMVRELPALLPAAKNAGMDNLQGFQFLLSTLQSASNKAGSNSEAANNVRNLLEKSLSADTTRRFAKMTHPADSKKGIDWQKSVLEGREKGESAVQVLSRLANAMLEKDSEYQSLKKKADQGDATAASQMNIMRGFVLSSIMPDVQAKAGLLAASDMQQISEYLQGLSGLDPKASLVDKKIDVLGRDDAFQQEKNRSLSVLGQSGVTDPLNSAETKFTELTAEYPNATLAIKALTAAAMAGSIAAPLLFGGKAGLLTGLRGLFGIGSVTTGTITAGGAAGTGTAAAGAGTATASGGSTVAAALTPMVLAALPLALMGGATYVASRRDKYDEMSRPVVGFSEWLSKMLPDFSHVKSSQERYMKAREELNGGGTAAPAAMSQNVLDAATYQAGVRENAAVLSTQLEQINGTLASQQQIIQVNSTMTIDGRAVAEQVSRHQVAMFNRGAAQ